MTRAGRWIVMFEADANDAARAAVQRLLVGREGVDPRCRWHDRRLLTVRDGERRETGEELADAEGVRAAIWLPDGARLVDHGGPCAGRVVAGGVTWGGGDCPVVAGPCSVEDRETTLEIADMVAEAGAAALRGGAFKPRTSPYAYGGAAERGLEILAEARQRTGLPVVTEALDLDVLDAVARVADVIQIGSRNMHASSLLFAAGAHPRGRPVLLKRGLAATVEELLDAAEYVVLGRLAAGHPPGGVILCERGVRTFETATRFTLDVAAVAVLQERTPLPVVVDPSHPAGRRKRVGALARAAVAAGAAGLVVEAHVDPLRAWCDGAHSLDPELLRRMVAEVEALRAALRGLRSPPPA